VKREIFDIKHRRFPASLPLIWRPIPPPYSDSPKPKIINIIRRPMKPTVCLLRRTLRLCAQLKTLPQIFGTTYKGSGWLNV